MEWILIIILAVIIILMAGHEESKIRELDNRLDRLDKEEAEIEEKIKRVKDSINRSIVHE